MKPSGVDVVVPNVGVNAGSFPPLLVVVAVIFAEAVPPFFSDVMVAVASVLGLMLYTVTKPPREIITSGVKSLITPGPNSTATAQLYKALWLRICTVKPVAVAVGVSNIGVNAGYSGSPPPSGGSDPLHPIVAGTHAQQ